MSEVIDTIEIHSPKNPSQKWIINTTDYKPDEHVIWGKEPPVVHREVVIVEPVVVAQEPIPVTEELVAHMAIEPAPSHMMPSVPDFVTDDAGNIVGVNIIDPDKRTSRRQVLMEEYDPDKHELWSTHPRFNR